MSVGLGAVLAQARTTIAALTATTAGPPLTAAGAGTNTAFRALDATLRAEQQPPAFDRYFEARPAEEPIVPGPIMLSSLVSYLGTFEVVVKYDLSGDLAAGDDRISEDVEQIARALGQSSNWAAGTELQEFLGVTRRGEGHFVDAVLRFRAHYTSTL